MNPYMDNITYQFFFKIKIDNILFYNNTGVEFEYNNTYLLMYSNETVDTIPLILNETITYNLKPSINTIFCRENITSSDITKTSIRINSTYTLNYTNNNYIEFIPKINIEDDQKSFPFLFEKTLSYLETSHNISFIIPYNLEILNIFSLNFNQIEEFWFIKFSNITVSIDNSQKLFDLIDNTEDTFNNFYQPFIRNIDIKNSIDNYISIIKSSLSFYLLINSGIICMIFYIGFNSIHSKRDELLKLRNKIINIGVYEQFDDYFDRFIQNYFYKQFLIGTSVYGLSLFILNFFPLVKPNLLIILEFIVYIISFIFIITFVISKIIKYSIYREIRNKNKLANDKFKSFSLKIQIFVNIIAIFTVIYDILRVREFKIHFLEVLIVICIIAFYSDRLALIIINILYQYLIKIILERVYFSPFLKKQLLQLGKKLKRVDIRIVGLILCFFTTLSTLNLIDNNVQENRINNYMDLSIQITFNNFIEPKVIEQYLAQNNIELYYNYYQLICPTKYNEFFIDVCILNDSLYEKSSRMQIKPNIFKRIDFNNQTIYLNQFRFNLEDYIYTEIKFPSGDFIDLKNSNLQHVSEMAGIITYPYVKSPCSEIIIMESMLDHNVTIFDNQTFVINCPENIDVKEFLNKILNDFNWAILNYYEYSSFNTHFLISNPMIYDYSTWIFLTSIIGLISMTHISLNFREVSSKNERFLNAFYPIDLIPKDFSKLVKKIQLRYLELSFVFILTAILMCSYLLFLYFI